MCVLYVGFGSKVRPKTYGCVAMGSIVFILRSILLLYSAGSGLNIVQVVLSGFSVKLFCFVQDFFVLVCVDVIVMSSLRWP